MNIDKISADNGFNVHTRDKVVWFTPIGDDNTVLLKLEAVTSDTFFLLEHRTPSLTDQHKGKKVDDAWVEGFLVANSNKAISDQPKSCRQEIREGVTYERIPQDYTVLKKTDVKAVVRAPGGKVLTLWKEGKPTLNESQYGSNTRDWERHNIKVTNWHYKNRRK